MPDVQPAQEIGRSDMVTDAERCLLLGTTTGLAIVRGEAGHLQESSRVLSGHDVTGVIARQGVILAGTTSGIFRSDDFGQSWRAANEGLHTPHVRCLANHPDVSDLEFAGTEPAGIYVSRDGAATWRNCPEVEALRDHHRWFLPYSPEAGCVRSFAFHESRAYAAVEVGGVLRSDDYGGTWQLAGGSSGKPSFDIPPTPQVFADVHWVEAHPDDADLVYAATAEGLYRSHDGGGTWGVTHAGSYCRAVWVDPTDPEHIVLSPADSVAHMNGRIERSIDGGRTWSLASDGLDLPWPNRVVERFSFIANRLFAITSDGHLHETSPSTMTWLQILPEISGIQSVAWYPLDG